MKHIGSIDWVIVSVVILFRILWLRGANERSQYHELKYGG